jgi:hypothetical protein
MEKDMATFDKVGTGFPILGLTDALGLGACLLQAMADE